MRLHRYLSVSSFLMDRLLALRRPLLPLLFFLLCNNSLLLRICALNSEGTALLSFRASMREDPANSMSNWNSSDQTPCAWNGVGCGGDGSVTSLSLPRKKLVGFLPSALGSLRSLRHVNLRSNRLFGRIPAGVFGAKALQSLVLYGNFLSGSLPPEIGGLLYLQRLDLSGNLLAGEVPETLLLCMRLRVLVLSHNNFSGSLPVGFGSGFVGLERLDLSYNAFNGTIPGNIGNLINLQGTLDLSHNWFSGSIPPSLGNLPERVYIDLTHNNLSGPIPQNGALENRGPTASIGNPGLCGPPLKNPCSSNSPSFSPLSPSNFSPSAVEGNETRGSGGSAGRNGGNNSTGLNQDVLIWIVVSDVVGIGIIALIFFYCYKKAIASITSSERGGQNSDKGSKGRKECNCFRKEESETLSENVEQHELVALDKNVAFNLDELLKSSAFVLGKSRIGIVYKVVMDDGRTLAVRRLGEGGSQRFKEFQTEVEAIGKVRHPNIVALRAYYWSVEEKLLIYDYIPNGNLHSAIHGKAGAAVLSPLSWEARLKIMRGISKGLAFLHEFSPKKYVHGDLRPNNVLLGHDTEPYISDFGVGRLANIAGGTPLQSDRMATEKLQSQQLDMSVNHVQSKGSVYHAPEALRTLKPSQKWDVYSYGVILLELISGRSATVILETSEMDLVHWIQLCIEEKKPLLDILDTSFARQLHNEDEVIAVLKIALACIQTNPEKRPSMRHVADYLENMN